jgi:glycerophosphoryl diester phosphodiesterase
VLEQTPDKKFNKPNGTDYVTDDKFWKENWDKTEADLVALDTTVSGFDGRINNLTKKYVGVINVAEFGALVNGTTNDTSAIQAAIDSLATTGGTVYIPHGCLYNRADLIITNKVIIVDDSGVKRHMSNSDEWNLSKNTEMEFIGHRGLSSLYPESSTIAMKNSIVYGQAHSVEFDIRHSSDEKLFAFHDNTLDRTTDKTGAISGLSEIEVRAADLGSKFSPIYAGAKIAYLYELCSVLRGLPVKNIYPQTNIGELTDETVQMRILKNTIDTFKQYGILHKISLQCVGSGVADKIRQISPEIKIALMMGTNTISNFNTLLAWAKMDRNCLIGSDYNFFLDNPNVALSAKKEGIDIFTWTVDNFYDVDTLRKANVYKIMTNVNLMGVK